MKKYVHQLRLHLRWWFAQAATMGPILRRAGAPEQVCVLNSDIVSTCACCGTLSRPPAASVANVEVTDTFNQQVACGLMCVYRYIVLQLSDSCARWPTACLVLGVAHPALLVALGSIMVGIHGPMLELIRDGESGISRD